MLKVAKPGIATVLFTSAVSAPLMPALPVRVPIEIVGPTGVKKSAVAQEFQRMYGAFVTTQDFPLNFESTSTATSYLGFAPQHMLGVADDAYPKGSSHEAERQRAHVRSLIHNYVNGQTRERATREGGLATSRPIRCLLWLTAETDLVPPHIAESTAYRVLKLRLGPDDVNEAVLSEIQGVPELTIATRAYIEHLAADPAWRSTAPARFTALVAELRIQRAALGLQDRQPEIIAALLVAFENWLRWAAPYVKSDEAGVQKTLRLARSRIISVAAAQTAESRGANPASAYVETLKALLRSGRARVVERHENLNGASHCPEIGWYDNEFVIFEPASAHHEVVKFSEHDVLPYGDIFDRLVQAKLCEAPTTEDKTATVRKGTRVRAGGRRGYFLVFKREAFVDVPLSVGDVDDETKIARAQSYAAMTEEGDDLARVVFSTGGDA